MKLHPTRRTMLAISGAALAAAPASLAHAQDAWPPSAVKIIVPYPAGGTADGLPRIIADDLAAAFKQPVVIENRAGAGGNVGADVVAKSAPDGLTLLATPMPVLTINQFVYKKMSFDPQSFKAITVIASSPSVLAVSNKLGAKSVAELIQRAKTEPGKISYASQGNGSTSHVTAAIFEHKTGIKISHVPYRGSAPAMNDLVGGHVDLLFDNLSAALNQHRGGNIRILAVCTPERHPALSEIPTLIETGLAGFVSIANYGLVAPQGTPDAVIAKIHAAAAASLAKPDVRDRIQKLGATIVGNTPAEMAKMTEAERAMWGAAIRSAGIQQVE